MACKLMGKIRCFDVRKTASAHIKVAFFTDLRAEGYFPYSINPLRSYTVLDTSWLTHYSSHLNNDWPELTYLEALALADIPHIEWKAKDGVQKSF